jgi:serine/threonine-protein kinase
VELVEYLAQIGTVFTHIPSYNGNASFGVQAVDRRYFVKTAGDPALALHDQRVALLRNAARLASRVRHPSLPKLEHIVESPHGPLLVYRWVDGELLKRDSAAAQRFRALPVPEIGAALDTIYDLHVQTVAAGWIANDFYDGSLLYDFTARRLSVIDLDTYRDGAFHNDMGRMYGSSRFMAPEEFRLGARIDERTTVFTMGRTALVFLGEDPDRFRGSAEQYAVAARACAPDPGDRYATMAEFRQAWQDVSGPPPAPAPARPQ